MACRPLFGFGAGIFFWSYFLFEVPSNIVLDKVGSRIWIARVMVSLGIVSAAMAFVQGQTSFYILRLLLGAAEAGSFPGLIRTGLRRIARADPRTEAPFALPSRREVRMKAGKVLLQRLNAP